MLLRNRQFCHKKQFNIFVMSTQTPNTEILNGPGKSDLMFSLFDGKVVKFNLNTSPAQSKLKISKKVSVMITSLAIEDGSRNSWLFKAYVVGTNEQISGYYHSDRRKGSMKYDPKKFEIQKKKFQITSKF